MKKLYVGCGDRRLPGWTGVDIEATRAGVDIVADARNIPLESGCADEVMAIHLVEHFFQWEVPDALNEWHRLLCVGGKLSLEMPDIVKACRNVIEGRPGRSHPDQMGMWGIYGDPRHHDPFMTHKWGWTLSTLTPFLRDAGFVMIVERPTEYHMVGREFRDFRVEARKA